MNYEILPAGQDDLEAIRLLIKQAFGRVSERLGLELPVTKRTLQDMQELAKTQQFFCCWDNTAQGRILAACGAGESTEEGGLVRSLCVDAGYLRQGLAKKMMAHVESYLVSEHPEKHRRLYLFTGKDDPNTIPLYTKLGYTIYKETKPAPGVDFVWMEKTGSTIV